MKFEIKYGADKKDQIISLGEISSLDEIDDATSRHIQQYYNLRESAIRSALIQAGWTPPSEADRSITRSEAQRICNLLGVYIVVDDGIGVVIHQEKPVYKDIWRSIRGKIFTGKTISDYDGTAADSLISPEGMA